ncbi:GTP-binding protein [Robiginitalea sp. M366]|uniref:GTP-binding protein n=1 Tax=Robiginitalea aestuariiviva TaxID=3036903 RepID=UPI00240E580C|nr:GTP-binding protein [Robiginitalea aestuariiviva]MDG1571957.1 GTP-binding protein [Robiginitalea aestuariiviva]
MQALTPKEMSLPNEIVLRPRFQEPQPAPAAQVLETLGAAGHPPVEAKRLDDHVFLKFTAEARHFWSPQLHLEVLETEGQDGCTVYGVFGPNPTLWTFFMFLHFGVATIFLILGVWAYSSASLGQPYTGLLIAMGGMVVLWFVLYGFGRAGRARGKPQMHQLYACYRGAVEKSLL